AYGVKAGRGGLEAGNPAQQLRVSFGRSGPSVRAGSTHVGLGLAAVGLGDAPSRTLASTPAARANGVTYSLPGLSESYTNGPLGLEQGFTIARPPARDAAGPLTIAVALSGNVRAALAGGGGSVTLSHARGPTLRSGD